MTEKRCITCAEIPCECEDGPIYDYMEAVRRAKALAAGSRRAETNEDLAKCEASQSGAAKTAQRPTSVASSDKERE